MLVNIFISGGQQMYFEYYTKAYGIKVTVYRHPPACVFDTRVKFSLVEIFS